MDEMSPQRYLSQVLLEFDSELQFLLSQNVLTKFDVQKIKNQAEVSKNAMQIAKDESSFTDRAKDKLLNALIRDFEKSIQRTLDEAVSRKGDKALLLHRLNMVDRKISLEVIENNITQSDFSKIQIGLELLKSYIIRSLPEKISLWNTPKMDVGHLAKNYEQTILVYFKDNFSQMKFFK